METIKDEITKKIHDKILELFGPESALAQAMEDEDFFDKLADLVAYIYGLVALSQPRPKQHTSRSPYSLEWEWELQSPPQILCPDYYSPLTDTQWESTCTGGSHFINKVWTAYQKYQS